MEWGLIARFKPPLNKDSPEYRERKSFERLAGRNDLLYSDHQPNCSVRAVEAMEELTYSVSSIEAVVDRRFSTAELQARYGLKSRTTLLTRMKELGIKTYKEGNLVYVSEESLQTLDALHKCLKNPKAKLEECAAQVKNQMHNGSSPLETTIAFPDQPTSTTLLRLPNELVDLLPRYLEQPVTNWNDYEQLELIASKDWAIATSRLLPLLGRKSIPKLDDHNRFSMMGFVFWKIGRVGNQYEWKVTKRENGGVAPLPPIFPKTQQH